MLFLTQPQIDTCSFFGVNRDLNMYSKACSAQWLHVNVAKLKVFCSIPSGKWLENPPLRVETSVENLKHDLKYLSRDLQPFTGSFRLKTSS